MYKSDVLAFFGGTLKTSKELGISSPSVSQWPKIIPARRAYELERITEGELKVDPELYSNN